MAILGVGIDLVRIERLANFLARHGERGKARLFSAGEQAYCEARKTSAQSYAGRFAVKEAVMKVLGTGWARGVRWVDIEVVRPPGQPPTVALHGATARIAAARGIAVIHIAITHDAGISAAVAVAESGLTAERLAR
ncbi:MAG TPA: holo-ACP synthase [Planctomycetota bacterium]|nr:holo-ACP synthase [Planctomycetota bacterium]